MSWGRKVWTKTGMSQGSAFLFFFFLLFFLVLHRFSGQSNLFGRICGGFRLCFQRCTAKMCGDRAIRFSSATVGAFG
ncbi:hypothetical protein DFJ73DRAFT_853682 [Zopfochytrium polystomum]|nr:hypothetical protein DFJ73DRAFT_853682 [Zopfochytrium polystomum]